MVSVGVVLLEKAISALLGAFWPKVNQVVEGLNQASVPGEEKRKLAVENLRQQGSQSATWLLNAGIEIAYGKIVKRLTQKVPQGTEDRFRDSGFNG